MAAKTISLEFNGYWLDKNIGSVPKQSGIYVVYQCTYSSQANAVSLLKVIYIGEAENANERIAKHEKWPLWRKQCGAYNQICFSFASITSPDRQRGEAAMIYRHKPPVNDEYKNTFPFDQTTMSLNGKTNLLDTSFTVYRKDS